MLTIVNVKKTEEIFNKICSFAIALAFIIEEGREGTNDAFNILFLFYALKGFAVSCLFILLFARYLYLLSGTFHV